MLDLGYAAVQAGTRFIATAECTAHADYKKAILDADEDDVVATERITGVPLSVIRTPFIERMGTKAGPLARLMLKGRKTKHSIRGCYSLQVRVPAQGRVAQGRDVERLLAGGEERRDDRRRSSRRARSCAASRPRPAEAQRRRFGAGQLVVGVQRRDLVALRERRVVEDRVDEDVERAAEREEGLADVDELRRGRAEDVDAEELCASRGGRGSSGGPCRRRRSRRARSRGSARRPSRRGRRPS